MVNTFEEDLKKLEEIVSKLDTDLSLDESIKIFEEGIKISKKCSEKLDDAEKKINVLIKDKSTGIINEEKYEE